MELIVIILGIISVVAAMEQEKFQLPQDKILNAQKFSTPCAEEYNLDPTVLNKVADGTLPRDETHNKYLFCFATKGGFVDPDGHIVISRLAGFLGQHPRVEEFIESLKKCNEITKENPIATTVEMNICFTSRTPIRFLL